jgi:iron complex outermembrane receptor protein
MSRRLGIGVLLAVVCVLALPIAASAQSQVAGTVKDESGGVLPGVTVEAASPALIEKSKSAVTDSNGRFQIVDLRQGTYKVTFTLTGFSTVVS